ncbi:hypothetical protein [Streptomyces sp. CA-251251]|uniref:hypothetical protein n=1 Tax=Streptomyces sp. CA-251251 TaxID=3240063 RepID=UPI003D8AD29E
MTAEEGMRMRPCPAGTSVSCADATEITAEGNHASVEVAAALIREPARTPERTGRREALGVVGKRLPPGSEARNTPIPESCWADESAAPRSRPRHRSRTDVRFFLTMKISRRRSLVGGSDDVNLYIAAFNKHGTEAARFRIVVTPVAGGVRETPWRAASTTRSQLRGPAQRWSQGPASAAGLVTSPGLNVPLRGGVRPGIFLSGMNPRAEMTLGN